MPLIYLFSVINFVLMSMSLFGMDESEFRNRYFAATRNMTASSDEPRMTILSPQGTYTVVVYNGYIRFITYGVWNHERAHRHPGKEVDAVQFPSETKVFLMYRDGGSEMIDLVAYFK